MLSPSIIYNRLSRLITDRGIGRHPDDFHDHGAVARACHLHWKHLAEQATERPRVRRRDMQEIARKARGSSRLLRGYRIASLFASKQDRFLERNGDFVLLPHAPTSTTAKAALGGGSGRLGFEAVG